MLYKNHVYIYFVNFSRIIYFFIIFNVCRDIFRNYDSLSSFCVPKDDRCMIINFVRAFIKTNTMQNFFNSTIEFFKPFFSKMLKVQKRTIRCSCNKLSTCQINLQLYVCDGSLSLSTLFLGELFVFFA